MKKLLTGILTLSLAATMAVPAFAANTATNDGTDGTNIAVNGTYQAGAPAADVISVDLAWDAMDFTYTAPSKGDWNAKTHEYENATAGGWTATNGTDPKITVTNHSNLSVEAAFAFSSAVENLNGTFTKSTLTLATAEGTEVENAPKDETSFSVDGTGIDADKALGTITVTVGEAYALVSTEEELNNALAAGKAKIRLKNDITMTAQPQRFDFEGARVIDLNNCILSATSLGPMAGAPVHVNQNCTMTIKNGTIRAANNADEFVEANAAECYYGGNLTLESCTLESYSGYALKIVGAAVTLKDCTIISHWSDEAVSNKAAWQADSRLTFSGNTTIQCRAAAPILTNGTSSGATATTVCLPGTYNFDPTAYVDQALYSVTANTEAGTWTVTAN